MLRLEIFTQIISIHIHIPEIGDTCLVDSLKGRILVNKHEAGDINRLTKSGFNQNPLDQSNFIDLMLQLL